MHSDNFPNNTLQLPDMLKQCTQRLERALNNSISPKGKNRQQCQSIRPSLSIKGLVTDTVVFFPTERLLSFMGCCLETGRIRTTWHTMTIQSLPLLPLPLPLSPSYLLGVSRKYLMLKRRLTLHYHRLQGVHTIYSKYNVSWNLSSVFAEMGLCVQRHEQQPQSCRGNDWPFHLFTWIRLQAKLDRFLIIQGSHHTHLVTGQIDFK